MAATTQSTGVNQELLERIVKGQGSAAMLPQVAMEALDIAKDPKCSMAEFARVIERDPQLAAKLLRISNSVLYSPKEPIASIDRAVVRLGFRECKNLILASSMSSILQRMSQSQQRIRESLWQHSITTAVICRHLNSALRLGFQGEEFVGGLMHDIGRILLAIVAPDQFAKADPLTFDEVGDEVLQHETKILGIDHCECGAWFGHRNNLPASLISCLRFHHRPMDAGENARLALLIAAGDHMANHLQRWQRAVGYDPEENRALHSLVGEPVDDMGLTSLTVNVMDQAIQAAAELQYD